MAVASQAAGQPLLPFCQPASQPLLPSLVAGCSSACSCNTRNTGAHPPVVPLDARVCRLKKMSTVVLGMPQLAVPAAGGGGEVTGKVGKSIFQCDGGNMLPHPSFPITM